MIGIFRTQRVSERRRCRRRGGYTLLELVVSSAAGAVLVSGLSGSLYIASQSFDRNTDAIDQALGQEILGDLMRNLNQAIRFTVRTNTAVVFTVPDRNGDGMPEEIAYAWGGAAGTPLIYSYNNSAAVLLASDVQNFDLRYLTRMMTAAIPPPPSGADKLLLVVTSTFFPNSQETARQSLFESWGYTVTRINDGDTQANYDTQLAANDLVFVSREISDTDLGIKLAGATIGVVNEKPELVDEMGFSSASVSSTNASIEITDNTHYITAEFAVGPVALVSTDQPMTAASGTIAVGLTSLGLWGTDPGLAVLETGAVAQDSSAVAGRRVSLPWGGSSFDIGLLTGDGLTMLRLAIEWAGGAGEADVPEAVGHWQLDETTGTIAADSSGNGHDGTYENGPTLGLSAIHELGAQFDGIDDRVRVPDDAAFSSHTSTGLTVSAWVKVHAFDTDGNGQARQPIVSKGYLNEFEWALNVYDDGRAEFTTWQADGTAHSAAAGGSITLDQWVHVTGTHEPGVASRVYVDGVEVASDTTFVGSTHDGTRDLFIATLENFQYLNATIDDVRIYSEMLSSAEVASLAADGSGGASAGIVMEGFNEATHTQSDADMGTVDISTPVGTAEGDLLIVAVSTDSNTLGTLASPAGWTLLHAEQENNAVTISVWWKLASASESSVQQFSWTDASKRGYGWMMRFTGHDPSSPIQEFTSMKGAASAPTTDKVATATANSLVLFLGGFDDDDITIGDPGLTGMTAINMGKSNSGNGTASGGAGFEIQASAGDSATPSFALTKSEEFVTITIAIEPAP